MRDLDTRMKDKPMKYVSPLGALPRLVTTATIAALTLAGADRRTRAQAAGVDPEAAQALKRMTDYVGKLQRFSVDTSNTLEVVLGTGQKIQFTSASRNTVQRPNKLRSERVGDVISQSFYYDGRTLTVFNPDDGFYATVPAPGTIDAMAGLCARLARHRCARGRPDHDRCIRPPDSRRDVWLRGRKVRR